MAGDFLLWVGLLPSPPAHSLWPASGTAHYPMDMGHLPGCPWCAGSPDSITTDDLGDVQSLQWGRAGLVLPLADRRQRRSVAVPAARWPTGRLSWAGPTAGPGPVLGSPGCPLHSAGHWYVDQAIGCISTYR
jgi:hypothetical protein